MQVLNLVMNFDRSEAVGFFEYHTSRWLKLQNNLNFRLCFRKTRSVWSQMRSDISSGYSFRLSKVIIFIVAVREF